MAQRNDEIVRGTQDGSQRLGSKRRVLLATDGSERSAAAVRAVAKRPWPKGSEFKVVSVEEPWTIKPSGVRQSEQAQEAVSSAEQMLASSGLKTTGEVLLGNAKKVILDEAQKWTADMIVVGSHGRTGFKRFLLGSVSEAVAMNAHCSVVVVRGAVRHSKTTKSRGRKSRKV
jgi:nucleotide-binding universal stress UspA family protein